MEKPLVLNIQKYSVHDGEGIRTTVFFKGCPLSCRWCHNPESQRYQREMMIHAERCTGCGACKAVCPHGAALPLDRDACRQCGACVDACFHNAREWAGQTYEVQELVQELKKDRMFYEQSKGGVTLSGGEVMTQDMDYICKLAQLLHGEGISVNIDTCGYADYERFRRILPYTDVFLYDIKLMDPAAHKQYTGTDNRLILENLRRLSSDGAKINIRLPLIAGVNANGQHIMDVAAFLRNEGIRVYRINLLKYHATGSGKYAKLGRTYEDGGMAAPDDAWLEQARARFLEYGFTNTNIGG